MPRKKQIVDKFSISVARVARIEDSWFYLPLQQRYFQRYFQPEQLKEENLNMNASYKVT